jgi:acyl-CoA hydrolase
MTTEAPRPPVEVRSAHLVLPGETNAHGTLFGGSLVQWMDQVAAIAAVRFCGRAVVTASLESIDFRRPVRVGAVVELIAAVIYSGRTSLIVRVAVYGEHPGSERVLCTTGYFSLVAVDAEGRPAPVPPLAVTGAAAERDWREGEAVRRRAAERRQPHQSTRPGDSAAPDR